MNECPICNKIPQGTQECTAWQQVYVGTRGHCHGLVCGDCWEAHVYVTDRMRGISKDASRLELALFLTSEGLSQQEVAKILKVGKRTIQRWWSNIRKKPDDFKVLLAQFRCFPVLKSEGASLCVSRRA